MAAPNRASGRATASAKDPSVHAMHLLESKVLCRDRRRYVPEYWTCKASLGQSPAGLPKHLPARHIGPGEGWTCFALFSRTIVRLPAADLVGGGAKRARSPSERLAFGLPVGIER